MAYCPLTTVYFCWPTIQTYKSMGFAWHDIGMIFQCLNNLFDLGDLYLYNGKQCFGCGLDSWRAMQVHVTPIFYVVAPIVRLTGIIGLALLQSGALVLTAIFIYLNAVRVTSSRFLARLIA